MTSPVKTHWLFDVFAYLQVPAVKKATEVTRVPRIAYDVKRKQYRVHMQVNGKLKVFGVVVSEQKAKMLQAANTVTIYTQPESADRKADDSK